MPQHESIPRRLNVIKRLAREYFLLDSGALIEKHAEPLRVFDIRSSKHAKHPHWKSRVYITRRALKHIVESRKQELLRNHTEEEAMAAISFAIQHLPETIIDFDKYELEPPSQCYTKDFSHAGKPMIRVALEEKDGHVEIKSIHFKKRN